MDALEESSPGVYTITLRVPPGRHWYVFYSDGLRILDRLNGDTGVDPDGRTVSYFFLFLRDHSGIFRSPRIERHHRRERPALPRPGRCIRDRIPHGDQGNDLNVEGRSAARAARRAC